ncbi:hypothetical protein COU00_01095 [Candidatus Falkowbacteria bacterium CG10_big_fil_rev_8_21_14_0_10_43_11]|uniref:Uncharacterized protein n=1 Tax=Candidatus Falkowbacteria bacterium CG10_big_fil_rev_8_21_14_0_10_43_11 TaxID=1974568 RepID=A0A2M6WMQ4_9BACT|nr:MAG: hypothetical protein COU00_01095 [Candidatus Falkowbacteria bacterium CG10_big_fil_rev_8_21_14_0_10_43_11]
MDAVITGNVEEIRLAAGTKVAVSQDFNLLFNLGRVKEGKVGFIVKDLENGCALVQWENTQNSSICNISYLRIVN